MPEELTLPGLIEDTRSQIDKDKDYQHQEIAPMAVALNWDRDISECPNYSIRNQDGSGSCVAQGIAKALEIITGTIQSAHPIYRRRANFPDMGMWLQDGGNIVRHLGTTTEVLDPSQNMNELQMNADIMVETPLKLPMYIMADFKDMDVLATAIEVYKQCTLTINGNLGLEYAPFDKPKVIPGSENNFGHLICGIFYLKINGEKCIIADESWGNKNIKRRILTESYLKARGTGAMYFVPAVPIPTPQKPKFHFTVALEYGQTSLSIKNLQDVLKYEGLFPQNTFSSGYYGEITRKAVWQWQLKHSVDTPEILNALQGKRVGPKTIAKLNELYN